MDHYEVLGVHPGSSQAEIRRAYLALARRHHPDFHEGPARRSAERHMQELNAAWAVLGDRQRRADYDRARRSAPGVPPSGEVRRTPFRPYDDDEAPSAARPGGVGVGDDLTDESLGTGARPPRLLTVAPAGLFLAAVAALSAGVVARFGPLLVLGMVCAVLSALGFVVTPMVAAFRSRASER